MEEERLSIAVAVLHVPGFKYALQRRDSGEIGLFGGELTEDEINEPGTLKGARLAVAREVSEETTLDFPPRKYAYFDRVSDRHEKDGKMRELSADVFEARVGSAALEAIDGELVIVDDEGLIAVEDELTIVALETFSRIRSETIPATGSLNIRNGRD